MANPTGLLTSVIKKAREPLFQGFATIIRELLGQDATEQQVHFCLMSIHAQCFGPLMHERRHRMGSPEVLPGTLDSIPEDVEILSDHVTRFSLAGIRGIRDHMGKDKLSDVKESEE